MGPSNKVGPDHSKGFSSTRPSGRVTPVSSARAGYSYRLISRANSSLHGINGWSHVHSEKRSLETPEIITSILLVQVLRRFGYSGLAGTIGRPEKIEIHGTTEVAETGRGAPNYGASHYMKSIASGS